MINNQYVLILTSETDTHTYISMVNHFRFSKTRRHTVKNTIYPKNDHKSKILLIFG